MTKELSVTNSINLNHLQRDVCDLRLQVSALKKTLEEESINDHTTAEIKAFRNWFNGEMSQINQRQRKAENVALFGCCIAIGSAVSGLVMWRVLRRK